jgi:glycosyltransferase involved in cell wall biosynthesis
MRVLLATDCYPPPLLGGRDLHVRLLARELSERGHEVEVVTLAGPAGASVDIDGHVPVHRIAGWSRLLQRYYVDPSRPFHPTIPDPGMVAALAALVHDRRPDVVHAHSWIVHSFLPFLPSESTRLVMTLHDYGLECPKNTFVHRGAVCHGSGLTKCLLCAGGQYGALRGAALTTGLRIMRRAHRKVDWYMAVSRAVAEACASRTARDRPITIIPPFVEDPGATPTGTSRPDFVPPDGDYVMFAGALGPHKGVDVLLDAWTAMRSPVPLVLAGMHRHDSPCRFPPSVILAEDVPHEDVLRGWAHCSLAVVPSCWPDPHPLVALEAMAAGRPVIASAVGGLPDIVEDGRTGILVPPGDVATLQGSIERLLADPELRHQMGERARERAADYLPAAVVPRIEEVYRKAIGQRAGGQGATSTEDPDGTGPPSEGRFAWR